MATGFLTECLSRIRRRIDEPSANAKYSDAHLLLELESAFAETVADININTDHPVVVRANLVMVEGQQSYPLPPGVGEVWRVAKINTASGLPEYEVWPGTEFSGHGQGFQIEGNMIRFLQDWKTTETLEILYIPRFQASIHEGTATSVTLGSMVFAAVPSLGLLDTRAEAYNGYVVRILSASTTNDYVQARPISSYDHVTRTATFQTDLSVLPTGTITYEVVPSSDTLVRAVVTTRTALNIVGDEGDRIRTGLLTQRLKNEVRALRMDIENRSARFPKYMNGDTMDNQDRNTGLAEFGTAS